MFCIPCVHNTPTPGQGRCGHLLRLFRFPSPSPRGSAEEPHVSGQSHLPCPSGHCHIFFSKIGYRRCSRFHGRGPRLAEPHVPRACPPHLLGSPGVGHGGDFARPGDSGARDAPAASAPAPRAPPAHLRPPRPRRHLSASAAVNKVLARRKRKRRVSMAAAAAAAAGPVLWRRLLGLLPGRPGLAALLGRLSDRLGRNRDRRRRR